MKALLASQFIALSNSDLEFGGWASAKREGNTIVILESELRQWKANSASLTSIPKFYVDRMKRDASYLVVAIHAHSVKVGNVIQDHDPYWSVSVDKGARRIVQNRYLTEKKQADDFVAEALHKHVLLHCDIQLFIHPRYGSEGKRMTAEDVEITAMKYDIGSLGNVKEIPIEVV